jgi:hypothetical protein
MPQGFTTVDFGPFPGASDTFTMVTGQATITSSSLAEAWIRPVDSVDHTADEHLVETLGIKAGNIVPGTGFPIYAFNTNILNEPVLPPTHEQSLFAYATTAAAQLIGVKTAAPGIGRVGGGGQGTRLYGVWNVNWVWN